MCTPTCETATRPLRTEPTKEAPGLQNHLYVEVCLHIKDTAGWDTEGRTGQCAHPLPKPESDRVFGVLKISEVPAFREVPSSALPQTDTFHYDFLWIR